MKYICKNGENRWEIEHPGFKSADESMQVLLREIERKNQEPDYWAGISIGRKAKERRQRRMRRKRAMATKKGGKQKQDARRITY